MIRLSRTKIRKIRFKLKLTKAQFGALFGLTENQIDDMESGRCGIHEKVSKNLVREISRRVQL
jgi:DNA-binding transcriptional regulator YiaG